MTDIHDEADDMAMWTDKIGIKSASEIIRTLSTRLREAEARPAVRVKPLIWDYHPSGAIAAPPTGHAYIIDTRMKGRAYFVKGIYPSPQYDTLEAAKSAAEADHAARILSQIDAVPAAQVRAEALDALLADDEMCLRLAEGYDREDAAQRGEPSPHTMGDEGYAEWAADRIACAKEGLRALIEKEQT